MIIAFFELKFSFINNIFQTFSSIFQWIYQRRFNLVYLPLLVLSWLCYEFKFTSPVCPFYSGKRISTLLSNCNFVYRTYRPPIYIFSSKLQWIYMCIFNQLKLFSRLLNSKFLSHMYSFQKPIYYWFSYFCNILLKTPIFNRIVGDKVLVTHREIIESLGRSPVILDWYLPPWLVRTCTKCNKPRPLHQFISVNMNKQSLANNNGIISNLSLQSSQNTPQQPNQRQVNLLEKNPSSSNLAQTNAQDPSMFNNMRYNVVNLNTFSFRKASNVELSGSKNSVQDANQDPAVSKGYQEFYFDDSTTKSKDKSSSLQACSTDEGSANNFYTEYDNKNFSNITRGIILILPDYNLPYNICNQHCGCICNAWDTKRTDRFNTSLCSKCENRVYRDACSFNKESPCISLTKVLIADALRAGFICVEIHLNINMGIPIHIQGKWLGMTAYPFSLYGNSISDLDCAIGRISSRYPHLPIQAVGYSGGGNILIEYLLRAHDSRAIETIGSDVKLPLFPSKESTDNIKASDSFNKNSSNQIVYKESDKHFNTASKTSKASVGSITYSDGDKGVEGQANRPRSRRMHELKSRLVNKFNEKFKGRYSTEQDAMIDSLEYVDNAAGASSNDALIGKQSLRYQFNGVKKKNSKQSYTKSIKVSEKTVIKSRLDDKFKVFYNNLIKSAIFVNLNLKSGGEFFQFAAASQKPSLFKRNVIIAFLITVVKRVISGIFGIGILFPSYKKSCKEELIENIKILINRIHCSRSQDNLNRTSCGNYKCCHIYNKISFSPSQRLSSQTQFNGFESLGLYSLLTLLHNEFNKLYIESLIDPQTPSRSVLLPVNNPNWTLTLGDGYYLRFSEETNQLGGLFNPTDDVDISTLKRHLRKLYDDNIKLSRSCIRNISLPVLLISSLDNSLYGINDIDVYEPIRNSNILHVVTQSGGDCTFLCGTYIPTYWLKDPVIEFVQSVLANKHEDDFTG